MMGMLYVGNSEDYRPSRPNWWPDGDVIDWTENERRIVMALPCPCGLQYTRDLPGGGRAIMVPPNDWIGKMRHDQEPAVTIDRFWLAVGREEHRND